MKKKIYTYILGDFPIAGKKRMKKKCVCEKKKSAETKQEVGWATAQLGHDTMGNCIVTQQVMGMQFGLEDWVTIQWEIVS